VAALTLAIGMTGAGAAAPRLGAADRPVSVSPGTGTAGSNVVVTLPSTCHVPNVTGATGTLTVGFDAVAPSGPGAAHPVRDLTPGQSITKVTFKVPSTAQRGHYLFSGQCKIVNGATTTTNYLDAYFVVTSSATLKKVTLSPTKGPNGTIIQVTGQCAPTHGLPTAAFGAMLFSPADANHFTGSGGSGPGPTQHTNLFVGPDFPPGPYLVAAACSDADTANNYVEATFLETGAPSAPRNVAARPGFTTSPLTGPIIVTYTAPTSNGFAIQKYAASCASTDGGVTRNGVLLGATAAPITVKNATLKKHYQCRVEATNVKGTGPLSGKSAPITVGAPARISKPSVNKVAAGHLRVTFTNLTAVQANGSPLTSPRYTATCRSSNGGQQNSAVGSASPLTVTGLTPSKTYTCAVVAHNARGYSAASPPSSAHAA
jgi:hypothetical protein